MRIEQNGPPPYYKWATGEGFTGAERSSQIMAERSLAIVASAVAAGIGQVQAETIQSFTGDLRADATFTSCGSGGTLGATPIPITHNGRGGK